MRRHPGGTGWPWNCPGLESQALQTSSSTGKLLETSLQFPEPWVFGTAQLQEGKGCGWQRQLHGGSSRPTGQWSPLADGVSGPARASRGAGSSKGWFLAQTAWHSWHRSFCLSHHTRPGGWLPEWRRWGGYAEVHEEGCHPQRGRGTWPL